MWHHHTCHHPKVYILTACIPHTAPFIPMTCVFCNWPFAVFTPPRLFLSSPRQPRASMVSLSPFSGSVLPWGIAWNSFLFFRPVHFHVGFPGGSDSKESACNVGDLDLIPSLGRSPAGRHGNPLQYSCLENPHGQRLQSIGSQRVGHDWSD